MLPKPTILAFDTSAAYCAAALLSDGQITTRVDPMSRGQAEHLMPMLSEMLEGQNLSWQDLTAIGVGIGPGNFTGIRISVSAARGLALGLQVPAIGVSSLDALAVGEADDFVSRLPAPRDRHYAQTIHQGSEIELLEGAVTPPDPDQLIRNMVTLATQRAGSQPSHPRPAPLYVRPADAAPPRDGPPVILP